MRRVLFIGLVGVLGTGILVSLGVWQVQRLAWKEAILSEISQKIATQSVALPIAPTSLDDNLLSVSAAGVIGDARIRVLVSQKIKGAGYRIISPFETESRVILLDRGIIRLDQPIPPPPSEVIAVEGNLLWPDEKDGFTPEPDLAGDIWFARDVAAMASHLGTEPVLLVARSLSPAQPQIEPLPVSTLGIPNDHLNYAITWFSLAVIWVAMSGYFLYRQR